MEIVESLRLELNSCPGKHAEKINRKFEEILNKNLGFRVWYQRQQSLIYWNWDSDDKPLCKCNIYIYTFDRRYTCEKYVNAHMKPIMVYVDEKL